jgi:hypothetical protein
MNRAALFCKGNWAVLVHLHVAASSGAADMQYKQDSSAVTKTQHSPGATVGAGRTVLPFERVQHVLSARAWQLKLLMHVKARNKGLSHINTHTTKKSAFMVQHCLTQTPMTKRVTEWRMCATIDMIDAHLKGHRVL